MYQYKPQLVDQLVINWHITEACNYSCKYCYAHWDESGNHRDIIRDNYQTTKLLNEISQFFHPDNHNNPLRQRLRWKTLRLNIAGGEPLLYAQRVLEIVKEAHELGMSVSLISNGSRLDTTLMKSIAPYISLLGLSLDSSLISINNEIGRVDRLNQQLNIEKLHSTIVDGVKINPNMSLKINTVVNSRNNQDDMSRIIQMFNPDRWKVLRMLPVVNNNLEVTKTEFDAFVERHRQLGEVMCVEDNDAMTESYFMIDPSGRFFQNSQESDCGYKYSLPILDGGAESALSSMQFDSNKFVARYEGMTNGELL